MDATSLSLCLENKVPIVVFDVRVDDNIRRAIEGENIGTFVFSGEALNG
jgi:uridylate kinase